MCERGTGRDCQDNGDPGVSRVGRNDIIIKDKVVELAKLRKMFMPSVDTRGQQQWRVVKGRGTPGQLLTPHNGNAPPPSHSKCSHVQQ